MQSTQLPYIDGHTTIIAAECGDVWAELLEVIDTAFSAAGAAKIARALGCSHHTSSGPRPLALGSTCPGFEVLSATPARELRLEGQHRFSRYALIFRLRQLDSSRMSLCAETRAAFPGLKGRMYRSLIIGTRGHVVVVKLMLSQTRRRSER
jgi:hypothetical protein